MLGLYIEEDLLDRHPNMGAPQRILCALQLLEDCSIMVALGRHELVAAEDGLSIGAKRAIAFPLAVFANNGENKKGRLDLRPDDAGVLDAVADLNGAEPGDDLAPGDFAGLKQQEGLRRKLGRPRPERVLSHSRLRWCRNAARARCLAQFRTGLRCRADASSRR